MTRSSVARRGADVVASLAGSAALVVCAWLVRGGTVPTLELRIFRLVNGLPDALSPPMRGIQLAGILLVGPAVALGAFLLGRRRLALAALLVTVGKLGAERVVWQLVQRSRPGTTIPDAIVRGDTPIHGAAFVSGHVVLVTGLAWVLTPYLGRGWRALPWLLVVFVAFSRVYLGAHAPLDVLGGMGLGLAIGAVANLIVGVPTRPTGGEAERSVPRAGGLDPTEPGPNPVPS